MVQADRESSGNSITGLLGRIGEGDQSAWHELTPRVSAELYRMARALLRRQPAGGTFQPTVLLNEMFVRLLQGPQPRFSDRRHFFAAAACVMRSALVDAARQRLAGKRGGGCHITTLDEPFALPWHHPETCLALDEALTRLASLSQRQATIVDMRFFGGLTVEEVAVELGISPKTVKRDWEVARAWLYAELK